MSWPRTWACEEHRRLYFNPSFNEREVMECEDCRARLAATWEKDQDKILALSAEVKRLTDKLFEARFPGKTAKDLTTAELSSFYRELVPGVAGATVFDGQMFELGEDGLTRVVPKLGIGEPSVLVRFASR